MSSCLKCGKYSHGNKYCYNCYQEKLQQSIIKISKGPNTCIKCGKTIKQLVYCENCYRTHITLNVEDIIFKYSNDYTQKEREIKQKHEPLPKTEKAARKCTHCDKNALLGSYLCEDHYHTFVEEQNRLFYDNLVKIQKLFYLQQTTKQQITLCKICGKNSHNKPYCFGCYQKIKAGLIKAPKETYDNQKYECDNGLIVRSQGERTISDFLFKNNIPHKYEKELNYQEENTDTKKRKTKSIKPDFYIEGPVKFNNKILQDIYIEFFGLTSNKDYDKTNEYKMRVYKALKTTVIIIYPEDLNNYKKSLTYKLSNFTENKINYIKES